MPRSFSADSGAALIFLIGYVALFAWLLWHYTIGALKWKSRWTMLFLHVLVRMASQACGIGFSILGFENTDVFLAFLILGAEGYFTLVICAFRFLISWHRHNLPSHISWLEPPMKTDLSTTVIVLIAIFAWPLAPFLWWRNPMVWFHTLLILANAAIVVGGSFLADANYAEDSDDLTRRLNIAKISRTVGQSVFLACNALLMISIVHTMYKDRTQVHSRGRGKFHPTLIVLFIAWFPLIIRGIWGVLQSAVWDLSYMNPSNYTFHGFTPRFSALENVLGVMTEWLACLLLIVSYYPSRADPPLEKIEEAKKQESKA